MQRSSYHTVQGSPSPEVRVQQLNPFQVTGVDYTDALPVTEKGGVTSKMYVVLLTCAATRASHIETVFSLS